MEAMDKKKIDRLTKGLVLNIFVFVCCVVYIIVAILPKYTALGEIVTKINDTTTNVSSLKKDGVNAAKFTELLTQLGRKKEVPDVVFVDSDKLDKVLTKPTTYSKDYLSWLVDENNKVSIIDKEIQANDAILGNIIPVFTNSSSMNTDVDVANQITLASFISYVEKDILSKYSLVSYAPLGISNIEFPDKKDTSVNIGSFKITLDFKGKNSNIISLVDTLQKSGKLTIRGGKLIPENTQNTTISA